MEENSNTPNGKVDKNSSKGEGVAADTRQEIKEGLSEFLADTASEEASVELGGDEEQKEPVQEGLDELLSEEEAAPEPEEESVAADEDELPPPPEEESESDDAEEEESIFDMSSVTPTMSLPEDTPKVTEEKISEAKITRRRVLAILGILGLAGAVASKGYIERKIASLDEQSGTEMVDNARRDYYAKMGKLGAEEEEEEGGFFDWLFGDDIPNQYHPSPKLLSSGAQARLKKQTEEEPCELDEITKNYIMELLLEQAIEEPLVKEKINGQEVIMKKSVMDRLKAAAEELESEHKIKLLIGPKSHFRDNRDQYDLSKKYDIVGSIAGSYHLLGQAVDIQNAGTEKKEAQTIRKVMRKYGFRWGVTIAKGKRKFKANRVTRFFSNLWHALPGGISLKKIDAAFKESEVEDRVHFDMPLEQLEDTAEDFEELRSKQEMQAKLKADQKKAKKKKKKK